MKKITLFILGVISLFCNGQNALQFNGTNAYVRFGNNTNLGLAQFSLECWFKRLGSGSTTSTGTGGVTGVPLITKGRGEADGSNVDMNYFLGIRQTDSTLVADFEEGSGGSTPGLNHPIAGVTKLARNTWYHVVVTYDGATWKLYLNGLLESQVAVNQPVQNLSIQHSAIASALTSAGAAQGFFHGVIDEVRVWNFARSQSQIISTINSVVTPTTPGLTAQWNLNEGTGTAVANNATATITGTITGTNYAWVTAQAPFNLNIAPNTPTLVSPADTSKCHKQNVKLSVTVSDLEGDSLWVRFYGRKKNDKKDFSIIPLPDTQYYTSQINGATNAMYKKQMTWVTAKRDSLNIQFISGLGDCVENGDNGGNDVEWKRADTAMKIVETNSTIVFPTGIPYGLNVGNHDQSPGGNPNGTTTYYNQYFGVARFSGRNYWGGNYGLNADNNYQLFTAEGIDFIVINLEYDVNANPAVLTWANGLLQTYSTRKAIVASHWLVNLDGSFGAQGLATYNALKNNPNLFLMLCGHVAGESRRTDVFNGNTVHSVMSDYQGRTNGGNGWIRIMKLCPSESKIKVYTYSPYLNLSETDADSQFILDHDFGPSWTIIDSVKVASGQTAQVNWNNLLKSSDYEWYAKVSDAASTVKTQTYKFKTGAYQVKLGNDTTLCGSLNVMPVNTLSTGISYAWMNGSTSPSITVNTSTMVTLNVTDSLNCITKDTMNVLINNIPAQPGLIAGNLNPCIGTAQNYSVTSIPGATSYSWTAPAGWVGTFTNNILSLVSGTNSGSIFIYAQNSCGISPARNLALTVISIPITATISGNSSFCVGSGAQSYSTVASPNVGTYSWTLPGGWSGFSSLNILSTTPVNSGGILSVVATNSCGAGNTQTLSIVVNPLPTLTISSVANAVCIGSSLTLSASGANTFTWNNSVAGNSISVSPTASMIYSLTGTDANGCSNNTTKSITVNPLPVISVSGNTVICQGNNTNLNASGANTFTWSTSLVSASISVNPSLNTNYTVTGTDANGCKNFLVKTVNVNPLPAVSVSGASSLCAGSTIYLSGSGAITFTWSNQSTANFIAVSPGVSTNYTLNGTDVNGCSNSTVKAVTVYTLPVVSINGPTSTCSGDPINLIANGANIYLWNTSATGNSISVSPLTTGSYTVVGTDLSGCSSNAVHNVAVKPLPIVTLISGTNTVCAGDPLFLFAGGAFTYTWSTQANTASLAVAPVTNTIYSVSGTGVNGCTNTAFKNITVKSLPILSMVSSKDTVCSGTGVTLTAGGVNSFTWTNGSNNAVISVTPSSTFIYSASGTGSNGCVNSVQKSIFVRPLPNLIITPGSKEFCIGESVLLIASGASVYHWSQGAQTNSIQVAAVTTTVYNVNGTDLFGCSNNTNIQLKVNECTGLTETVAGSNYLLFPNPNNGIFVISGTGNESNLSVVVYNSIGQIVLKTETSGPSREINISEMANGIYTVRVFNSETELFRKNLIKE